MDKITNIKNEVRVRAAPSPTGRVHIGTIRTYLFNYLLYKKYGGANIFRAEDTDKKREVEGGAEAMLEAFQKVGIVFTEGPGIGGDFGPYIQSERLPLYKKYANELVKKGFAYYCFCSQDRLEQLRETQKSNKMKPMYDRCCRDLTLEEAEKRVANGEPYVIRMKFPKEGYTECHDMIYGDFKVKNSEIEDQVILKADGFPTYHLALVVDDHLMEITLGIRGREWMPSYPKHVQLYKAFGWDVPAYAHVPLILNPDGQGKLSKRHGAMPALAYLRKGYLWEAIWNYILICGWSPEQSKAHKDEIYTPEELIELFDIRKVHKVSARYDQRKFDYVNASHIRRYTVDQLADRIIDWAKNLVLKDFLTDKFDEPQPWEPELREKVKKYLPLWEKDRAYFIKALELERERLIVLSELPDALDFFYDDELIWTDEDWNTKNHNKKELADALEGVLPRLDTAFDGGKSFEHDKWEQAVRGYADELGWKHGDLFLAIRSAVTGRLQSPPLLECIEVIGWDKSKKFIQDAITYLKKS